ATAADVCEAARRRCEAGDYDGALTMARRSKRASEGKKVEVPAARGPAPVAVITEGRSCPTCNTPLKEDDVFCRKCGTRLVPLECASCGEALLPDDEFCAKCGARVSR